MEKNAAFGRPSELEEKFPVYVGGAGFDYIHTMVERPNGFPLFQWLYCTQGEGCFEIYGQKFELKKDTAVLVPPFVPHQYYACSELWTLDWVSLGGACLSEICAGLSLPSFSVSEQVNGAQIQQCIKEIVNIYQLRSRNRIIKASAYGYEILTLINQVINQPERTRLSKVLDYIEQNFERELTLEELSRLISVSKYQFCRVFRSEMKIRPFEYILKVRIRNAKYFLEENPGMDISEVSMLAGFKNQNYFREVFKKETGISPSVYRKIAYQNF